MFVLYDEWVHVHHQVPQAPLSQSFLKQLIRMMSTTADEKIFNVDVLIASNRCFANVLRIRSFAPQVLSYVFDMNSKLFICVCAYWFGCVCGDQDFYISIN